MSKKSNIKKIDKETRKLIESTSSMVKAKNGKYKFKNKLKKGQVKRIKKTCTHYVYRNGKIVPVVTNDPDKAGNWKCKICGASFPIKPLSRDEIEARVNAAVEVANQAQFFSVLMGGDEDDTKLFIKFKEYSPYLVKVSKSINKAVDKRAAYEDNKNNTNNSAVNDIFSGYGYR